MARFDVFNGDADGICALQQLRLIEPSDNSELVTGPKREIQLLKRVTAGSSDHVTVLDISLDSNRKDLERLLANGAEVLYFDHHYAGDPSFEHPAFTSRIDTAPDICTSLLVDRWLNGRHRLWAITAAFGDNLDVSARCAAENLVLSEADLIALKLLGECLNYNGYGENLIDLWFHPAELYLTLKPYVDPRNFIEESTAFAKLRDGYLTDLRQANKLTALFNTRAVAVFELPDASWARRVSGVLANHFAQKHPTRAHAILTPTSNNRYCISVRAPMTRPTGADALCRQFAGGGRAAAAGISDFPEADLPLFLRQLTDHFA